MEDDELAPDTASEDEEVVRERRCGRCRLLFPGEPGSHDTAQLGWWLCPPCHESLLGQQRVGRP